MKTTKTYSIDEIVYNAFDRLALEKNINKSSFIEEQIRKFLKDNDMDFIDKLYVLRTDPNKTVTVIAQDITYYTLSDGSKIQKILFMQIFQECPTVSPDSFFKNAATLGAVDPVEFFNKSNTVENLVREIKTKL